MELDEILFHFAWKTKIKFSRKKLPENACILSKEKFKLINISCAFFEKIIHIKQAEACGGLIGDALFLPKYIQRYETYDLNYQAYLYKIIYNSVAVNLGLYFRYESLSSFDFKFISLLCAPVIIKTINEEYPNLKDFSKHYFIDEKPEKKSHIFFQIWQEAILTPSTLEAAKLDNKLKSLIKNLLAFHPLDSNMVTELCSEHIAQLKKNNISHKDPYKIFDFFSNIPTTAQRLTIKGSKDSQIKKSSEEDEEKTLKYSKPKERVKNLELDEDDPDCNPASLLMEGVQTADIFSGGQKMIDGADEMDDHFDAIENLDMREVTRSKTQTQSIFKADISIEVDYCDLEEDSPVDKHFSYDEWDYKKKKYKKDWCQLIQNHPEKPKETLEFDQHYKGVIKNNKKEIHRLRKNIEQIVLQRRPKNRQVDGPEIDIDALINAKADIISGHTPNPNLYISKRKTPSDLSVLLLIDSSLSADSWVKGRRVLDIAKDSIIVIQEVLDGIFDNMMVASFYSNTRKNNSYSVIKNFDESWKANASKLETVKPNGYTRIGVALRHSFFHLEKVKTSKKVVLLLSDGKPTDYDSYEGKLGINDVRQCVREANASGIDIFSLAIDKDAKFYFPQLFGPQNYEVLSQQSTLPEQLIKLFSKMIH